VPVIENAGEGFVCEHSNVLEKGERKNEVEDARRWDDGGSNVESFEGA